MSEAKIAKRAGSSVGAVYHHFRDKKALFYALFNRMTETYEALNKSTSSPELLEGTSIRDLFQGYLEIMITAAREHGAAKAAVSAVVADFPELAAHYSEIQGNARKLLFKLVMERRSEIGAADPEQTAAFAIDQLSAMVRSHIDASQQAAKLSTPDDEHFVQNAVALVSSYLKLPPDNRSAG